MKRFSVVLLMISGEILGLSACGSIPWAPVKPWDRDILAQDKMQLGANQLERAADDKTYFSREASRGGGGLGGGGCGCN